MHPTIAGFKQGAEGPRPRVPH